ncbi:MAG: DNA-directed RNA polymerase subunit omega [Spirochaetales bacterium]|nr:DNA-directed RNA polymerase subunit omega [Spirochaetales bacterium]
MAKKQIILSSDTVLPLDLLVTYDANMYELTCAAIKRAAQINLLGDEELEENRGRVVSLAIKQILSRKIEYRLEE